jgi:hypothetical protein
VAGKNSDLIAQALYLTFCAMFFITVYCVVFVVFAAFSATDCGLIKWGEGWQALKNLFGV